MAMASAYRPPRPEQRPGFVLLAGDLHCHVSPPDDPTHVSRGLAETVALARQEHLDFVLLTPHVVARFFDYDNRRDGIVSASRAIEEAVRDLAPDLLVAMGAEYTDFEYGHLTMGFADIEAILATLPREEARTHPERFFERWVSAGGILIVNHPFLTPTESPFESTQLNLSWRPFLESGPFPREIEAASRMAQGIETYNLGVSHLRDGYLLHDPARSLGRATNVVQRIARLRGRRVAAIGGTDSHSSHLRAVTFVLAETRSLSGIRDAILGGRTCVRSPEACSFEARVDGGAWSPIGSSLPAGRVEVRGRGDSITILRNGSVLARPRSGEAVALDVPPGTCTAFHAAIGEGISSPIYVACPF
jgi:hypothetical protein